MLHHAFTYGIEKWRHNFDGPFFWGTCENVGNVSRGSEANKTAAIFFLGFPQLVSFPLAVKLDMSRRPPNLFRDVDWVAPINSTAPGRLGWFAIRVFSCWIWGRGGSCRASAWHPFPCYLDDTTSALNGKPMLSVQLPLYNTLTVAGSSSGINLWLRLFQPDVLLTRPYSIFAYKPSFPGAPTLPYITYTHATFLLLFFWLCIGLIFGL